MCFPLCRNVSKDSNTRLEIRDGFGFLRPRMAKHELVAVSASSGIHFHHETMLGNNLEAIGIMML